jgi:hypothetical protein
MTVFQELDVYLGQEFSVDYWSDEAILYAYTLVQKMTPTDWDALRVSWRIRPKEWQYRCAEILSQADPRQAIPVLLDMLQTPDGELAVAAADTLRTLYMGERNVLEVSPKVVERLYALAKEYPGLVAQTINELLQCLHVRA